MGVYLMIMIIFSLVLLVIVSWVDYVVRYNQLIKQQIEEMTFLISQESVLNEQIFDPDFCEESCEKIIKMCQETQRHTLRDLDALEKKFMIKIYLWYLRHR